MHASGHTYNQTCTCLCSSIKPPEHKQCGKPREMEKEKDGEVLMIKDMQAERKSDGEIKAVRAVLKIQDVRFIVSMSLEMI